MTPPRASVAAPAAGDPAVSHRIERATVTVRDAAGAPLSDAAVDVEQVRHAFAFGNIGFDLIPLANDESDDPVLARLAEQYVELFNAATLPFYWERFEPERGRPDTARLRRTVEWFRDRGLAVKGHPLVWHTLTAPWLLDRDPGEIERLLRERVRRDVGDFAGLVDTWDAINEVVIMPDFAGGDNGVTQLAKVVGRTAMVRLAFEEARAANPGATLLINDFIHSEAYERVIADALDAGVRIDAIGIQTHMHQGYRGEEHILGVVDRFARFGLPIHLTESTLLSGELMPPEIDDLNDFVVDEWPSTPDGEARQADELERHYRSLVGHPSVEAIVYWGMTDRDAWLGAPAGLVRADGTEKPSYRALHDLIKGEWWVAPTATRTDAEGRIRLAGFAGDYRVTVGGRSADVTLGPEQPDLEVPLG